MVRSKNMGEGNEKCSVEIYSTIINLQSIAYVDKSFIPRYFCIRRTKQAEVTYIDLMFVANQSPWQTVKVICGFN